MKPGEQAAVSLVAVVRDTGTGDGEGLVVAARWEASGVGLGLLGGVERPPVFCPGCSKKLIKRKLILSGHLTGRPGTLNRLDAGWGANWGRAGEGEEQKTPPVKGLAWVIGTLNFLPGAGEGQTAGTGRGPTERGARR